MLSECSASTHENNKKIMKFKFKFLPLQVISRWEETTLLIPAVIISAMCAFFLPAYIVNSWNNKGIKAEFVLASS